MSTMLNPDAVKRVLRQLMEVTVAFAGAQIDSGADALTVADQCTRDLCSPAAYQEFLAEIHHELHERIRCPVILHICGDTADRVPFIRETGLDCFHFDSKISCTDVRSLAGPKLALMGGTSNMSVVRSGTPEIILQDVQQKLRQEIDVIGPECAVPLDAPWGNLKRLADAVKQFSPRG